MKRIAGRRGIRPGLSNASADQHYTDRFGQSRGQQQTFAPQFGRSCSFDCPNFQLIVPPAKSSFPSAENSHWFEAVAAAVTQEFPVSADAHIRDRLGLSHKPADHLAAGRFGCGEASLRASGQLRRPPKESLRLARYRLPGISGSV
jgi:hypothetical protein